MVHDETQNPLINPPETDLADDATEPESPYLLVGQPTNDQPKEKRNLVQKIKDIGKEVPLRINRQKELQTMA